MSLIKIGDIAIGDHQPCFITFEAGPTHDGLTSALALVEAASAAGAQAIKFQIFPADRLIADKKQLFSYSYLDRETQSLVEKSEPLYDIFKRRQLSYSEWEKIKQYADKLGIYFFATAGFEEDIDFLKSIGCQSIKIASADLNHIPLLEFAAKQSTNIQIDTGNAEIFEIQTAVDTLRSNGCDSIVIHQCPTGYPARLPSINLRMIPKLKDIFPDIPIAYSDHTPDADMDIAAVAIGANLIEKTITLNKYTSSVEHIFSLEPSDMSSFVRRIRDVEVALGSQTRTLSELQKESRKAIQRSPYLLGPAVKGQPISSLSVDFKRPGFGLTPEEWKQACISNKVLNHDMDKGCMLSTSDLD